MNVWSHKDECVESQRRMCGVTKMNVWSHKDECVESQR